MPVWTARLPAWCVASCCHPSNAPLTEPAFIKHATFNSQQQCLQHCAIHFPVLTAALGCDHSTWCSPLDWTGLPLVCPAQAVSLWLQTCQDQADLSLTHGFLCAAPCMAPAMQATVGGCLLVKYTPTHLSVTLIVTPGHLPCCPCQVFMQRAASGQPSSDSSCGMCCSWRCLTCSEHPFRQGRWT
jgi:hypothetical protein